MIARSSLRVVVVIALASVGLNSCVSQIHLIDLAEDVARSHRKAEPESEWNESKNWKRVSDEPVTYIPTVYPTSAPRTEKEGTWLTDKRDGKRMFVPNGIGGLISTGVLIGEAKKITNNIKRSYITTEPGFLLMP
jgi:hypothetical protein